MDTEQALDLRILSPGQNWLKVGSMIALGLGGYYSPLPEGSTVSVTTADPGGTCLDAPWLVAQGRYDIGITTPAWYGRAFREGRLPIRPISGGDILGLGVLPHDDRLAFAVRDEVPIHSLADIGAQHYPLRVSTPAIGMRHPAGWVVEAVLNEYGFGLEDIVRWGGKILGDRPQHQNAAEGEPVSPEFEAVFDEAIMTRRWQKLTTRYAIRFLPVEAAVLRQLEQKGMPSASIARGRFPSVTGDVPTVDFYGWLLFCRADLPERIAYLTVKSLHDQSALIESLFPEPTSGLTGPIDLGQLAERCPIPLHPGARQYYAEQGIRVAD